MPVVGLLHTLSPDRSAASVAAFIEGLAENGYVEGRDVAIEYRWAEGHYDRLPALAADLVARKVDLIAVGGGSIGVLAAKQATATIPIIMCLVTNPVEVGLVASLAQPGGNVTGVGLLSLELTAKRLELISDLYPQARVLGLLVNPKNPTSADQVTAARQAADIKRLQLHVLNATTEPEIDTAFAALSRIPVDALVVGGDGFFYNQREQLAALAGRYAIPAVYELSQHVEAGGLISYGSSVSGAYRQAAGYVARILKGAKPADLPVAQPTKFELIINLKTAKALGLPVPQSLLLRADEVIE